jgi:hypothetical protein
MGHASVEWQQPTPADTVHLNSAWRVLNKPVENAGIESHVVVSRGRVINFTFIMIEFPSVSLSVAT